jgi:hypothetical protein
MEARALMTETVGLVAMQHLLGLLVRRTYAAALIVQWQSSKADTAAVDGACGWVADCPWLSSHEYLELAADSEAVASTLCKMRCTQEGNQG